MNKNTDAATMMRTLDAALLEQARHWRAFISRYDAEGDIPEAEWAEEFCLVVHNRLAKIRTQQRLAQVCRTSPGRHGPAVVSAVHPGPRRTAGKVVGRRMQDV